MIKNSCSSAVPTPPCAVTFMANVFVGMVLPFASKAFTKRLYTEFINSFLFFLNSSKIGPIKKPSVAKACPPQFKPDSILYSETQIPFLAKNLP